MLDNFSWRAFEQVTLLKLQNPRTFMQDKQALIYLQR
jgi:hypothetical protein